MKAKGLTYKDFPKKVRKGKVLLVDELFYSIQTEGPYSGIPAYFIRLYGCNLNCTFCDTVQKNKPKQMKVKSIVKKMLESNCGHLCIITGGEPFAQPMWELTEAIIRSGCFVQFETSGSIALPEPFAVLPRSVYIVVSPKTKTIQESVEQHAMAFKYVVSTKNSSDRDGLPKGLFRPNKKKHGKIYVSPMWTNNKKETQNNIDTCVRVCKSFGYHLSLQYHKLIHIR